MENYLKMRLQKEYILPLDEIGFFHKAGCAVEDVVDLPTVVLSAIVEAYLYVNCIKLMKDSHSEADGIWVYGYEERELSKCYREAYYMLKNTDWNLVGASVEPILQEIEDCNFNSIKNISDKKMLIIAGKAISGNLNKNERMKKLEKALYKIQYKKLENAYFDMDLTMEDQFAIYFQYIAYAMKELQDHWDSKQMIIAPLFSIVEMEGELFGILKKSLVTTNYVPTMEIYDVYNPMLKESKLCEIDKNGEFKPMKFDSLDLGSLGDDTQEFDGICFDEGDSYVDEFDFEKDFEIYEAELIAKLEAELELEANTKLGEKNELEYEEEDEIEYEEDEIEYEEDELEYEEDDEMEYEDEDELEYEEDDEIEDEEDELEYEEDEIEYEEEV